MLLSKIIGFKKMRIGLPYCFNTGLQKNINNSDNIKISKIDFYRHSSNKLQLQTEKLYVTAAI